MSARRLCQRSLRGTSFQPSFRKALRFAAEDSADLDVARGATSSSRPVPGNYASPRTGIDAVSDVVCSAAPSGVVPFIPARSQTTRSNGVWLGCVAPRVLLLG